jgi:Fe-S cluster assembly protein SufD
VTLAASLEGAKHAGPAWLAAIQREAKDTLASRGFPTKRDEAWRFTSVRDVVDTTFDRAPAGDVRAFVSAAIGDDGAHHVVMVEGRPVQTEQTFEGGRARSLAHVLANDPGSLEPLLGKIARREHFAALNAALFDDGLVIEIVGPLDRPIHVVHVGSARSKATAAYPRILVIGEGSGALIETYLVDGDGEKHLTNPVTEIALAEDASLDHTRVVIGGDRTFHLGYLAVRQAANTSYRSHLVTLGGALSRVELDVHLCGDGAKAELDGVYLVDRDEHVDHQLFVEHAKGGGTSHTRYRGILDGRGHAVFNAMGIVRPDAQRSAAHQENKNLLLSDDATIDTKPHLEIEADDVKASHGATIGSVDEEALFYLRSRGLEEAAARDLLTYAFVRELLDGIPHEPTKKRLIDAVSARLRLREIV